jgi:hypothetical protein
MATQRCLYFWPYHHYYLTRRHESEGWIRIISTMLMRVYLVYDDIETNSLRYAILLYEIDELKAYITTILYSEKQVRHTSRQ